MNRLSQGVLGRWDRVRAARRGEPSTHDRFTALRTIIGTRLQGLGQEVTSLRSTVTDGLDELRAGLHRVRENLGQ